MDTKTTTPAERAIDALRGARLTTAEADTISSIAWSRVTSSEPAQSEEVTA